MGLFKLFKRLSFTSTYYFDTFCYIIYFFDFIFKLGVDWWCGFLAKEMYAMGRKRVTVLVRRRIDV